MAPPSSRYRTFITKHRGALFVLLLLILLPFIVGALDGASPFSVLNNGSGTSKFVQGLAIEIFILALYALSYDLIFALPACSPSAIPCSSRSVLI